MIKLVSLEPHSWMMAVGDKRKGARYQVVLNGQVIGEVEKGSETSHRSDGTTSRIRWGFRGYSLSWEAKNIKGERVGYKFYSRKSAVDTLIREVGDAQ
jgi:hypothetical protein